MTGQINASIIYQDLIVQIDAALVAKYPNIKVACETIGISYHGYIKIRNGQRGMSIATYTRICKDIFPSETMFVDVDNKIAAALTIEEWLKINHSMIYSTMMKFQYS